MIYTEEKNMQIREKKRFDNFFLGFIVSIILPVVMLVLISASGDFSLSFYDQLMKAYNDYMFVKIAILALIPNLFIFFALYKTERWKSAGGLIVATILFVILMVLKV